MSDVPVYRGVLIYDGDCPFCSAAATALRRLPDVGENYESIADAVRTVTGIDRDPDPYHGEYPLTHAAADVYPELAANARQTHSPEPQSRGR